ncbi:PH domain-containing protein [Streptomyces ficellus]|uniref:PH domain-containing protein n=1 Tax=Streptomyces ficellus TaxID=1977088 RepID=A0ABT7Z6L9_9ACTN|nr:PH domain-containing protein [Streptomyces ficellus]MDN3295149.1 PH domain-containing protein [Streptomyces ficellus]
MTEPGGADHGTTGPAPGGDGDGWARLDKRAVLVTALVMAGVAAGACVPVLLGLSGGVWFGSGARRGTGLLLLPAGAVLLVAGGAAVEYVRWTRTRYRIGPERAELHTGLLLVKRRSLARERIRSVDLTANPLLRLLGLVKVRIGTGEHTGGGESTLELHPVSRAEGERLRRELLDRAPSPAAEAHRDGELARLDPRWIRYAPLSFVAPLLGGAAAGGVMQVSDWFGAQHRVIDWVGDRFRDTPAIWIVLVLAVAALVAGAVGALGLWVEMWWNYRLEREPGGTLRVRRGLLTARSISIEERRLRGVELVEPLGVRLCRAARIDAVATGLAKAEDDKHADHKTLLPAVPRALADDVAARVLRETVSPTGAPLTGHPRAARTRRLRWSLGAALLPVLVLAVLGAAVADVLLYVAAACAVVGLPLAVLLALDAYRSLGHGLSGDYLVARSGTVRRATVALQRGGVIGWTVKQSYVQRRAGLITLTATTAAGAGAYDIHDADQEEGTAFAAAAVPGLLEPFLERGSGERGSERPGPPKG